MRAINTKALFVVLGFAALAALALCPFAVTLHGLFSGDISSFDDALAPYRDFGLFADTLTSCLEDGELRVCLLLMAALFAALLIGSTKDAILNTRDREVKDGILGDQRVFTKRRDIARRNYTWSGEGAPPVDGIAIGSVLGRTVIAHATHAAVIAPSGSGKTRGSVYQTIDVLTYEGKNSLIVTDPSCEIYMMMAAGLEGRGYPVYLLDFHASRRGSRYNPLEVVIDCHRRGDASGAEARAREIGDILCPETGSESDFFTRAAGGAIAAVCYLVATLDEVPDTKRNLWSAIQTILKGTQGGTDKLKGFIASGGSESPAYVMASTFLTSADKVENSILSTLQDALQPFSSADMKYLTGASEISVREVIEKPCAVFMHTLPKGNQANKIASLFLAQHLAETLRRGDRATLNPVYVVGDEFHAIPRFDLVTAVEQGRKYGLHYYMYVQSLAGFDSYSTRTENGKDAVLANADVKVLYKAGTPSDAAYFEVLGGKRTVQTRNTGTSSSANSSTSSEGFTEREVMNWPQGEVLARDPVKDGVLVFTNISGEAKRNGKFEIPVPDVTRTTTARNFMTFGDREHEREVMSRAEAELERRASERFAVFAPWTPAYDCADDSGACPSGASDDDIFGL